MEISDDRQPKRPANAYMHFVKEVSASGEVSTSDRMKKSAELWRGLSASEKEVCNISSTLWLFFFVFFFFGSPGVHLVPTFGKAAYLQVKLTRTFRRNTNKWHLKRRIGTFISISPFMAWSIQVHLDRQARRKRRFPPRRNPVILVNNGV